MRFECTISQIGEPREIVSRRTGEPMHLRDICVSVQEADGKYHAFTSSLWGADCQFSIDNDFKANDTKFWADFTFYNEESNGWIRQKTRIENVSLVM